MIFYILEDFGSWLEENQDWKEFQWPALLDKAFWIQTVQCGEVSSKSFCDVLDMMMKGKGEVEQNKTENSVLAAGQGCFNSNTKQMPYVSLFGPILAGLIQFGQVSSIWTSSGKFKQV